MGLDQQVVDLGGHRVGVLADERREQVRVRGSPRATAAAAGSRRSGRARAAVAPASAPDRDRRDATIARRITSSRSPGTMTSVPRPDPLEHVLRLHRADGDAADDPVEVGPGLDRLAVDALEDHRRASGSRGSAGTAGRRAAGCRGAPGRARSVRAMSGLRVEVDLVDDRARRPARRGARRATALRTISSIGRPTPPSLTR